MKKGTSLVWIMFIVSVLVFAITLSSHAATIIIPNNTVDVTVTAYDEGSGVKEMQFSFDSENWQEWIPYTSEVQTLDIAALPQGMFQVYVQFRDYADRVNKNVVSGSAIKDTVDPTGTITIEGGIVVELTFTVNSGDE